MPYRGVSSFPPPLHPFSCVLLLMCACVSLQLTFTQQTDRKVIVLGSDQSDSSSCVFSVQSSVKVCPCLWSALTLNVSSFFMCRCESAPLCHLLQWQGIGKVGGKLSGIALLLQPERHGAQARGREERSDCS